MKAKRLVSLMFSFVMVCSLVSPALAVSLEAPESLRISRTAVENIHGSNNAMTESEAIRATNLIAEKETLEVLSAVSISSRNSAVERIATIEDELNALGAVPLTIEDIYELHGLAYNAPDVPDDTNYVHFYGMTTHIGNYDVYSIVASSTGFAQTDLSVPFYKADDIVIFDTDAYFESEFRQYIEMGASVAGVIFDEVFEKLPILDYVGDVWDLATYFNPTAQQKFTINYTCGQAYIFSYVTDESINYYDFTLTAERKQGNCTFKFEQYVAGDFLIPPGGHDAYNYEALSEHWADYSYAVELYQNNYSKGASYVGDIRFLVGGRVVGSFSMPTYDDLWSIPGI